MGKVKVNFSRSCENPKMDFTKKSGKGDDKMIKIRISYTDEAEQARFIGTITKGFKIVSLKAGKPKKNSKNMCLELR